MTQTRRVRHFTRRFWDRYTRRLQHPFEDDPGRVGRIEGTRQPMPIVDTSDPLAVPAPIPYLFRYLLLLRLLSLERGAKNLRLSGNMRNRDFVHC